VKFKVFSCYFVNSAASEHEANYAVLQQPKSQPSPVFINELLVRQTTETQFHHHHLANMESGHS